MVQYLHFRILEFSLTFVVVHLDLGLLNDYSHFDWPMFFGIDLNMLNPKPVFTLMLRLFFFPEVVVSRVGLEISSVLPVIARSSGCPKIILSPLFLSIEFQCIMYHSHISCLLYSCINSFVGWCFKDVSPFILKGIIKNYLVSSLNCRI